MAIRDATGVSGAIVREVLDEWTRRPPYLAALIAGAARFGLDGEPSGAVTTGQASNAAAKPAQRAACGGADEPTASG